MRGKLITFEGCEGVGKSTQVELLKKYLEDTRQDALFLREPGGTKISEKIRGLILDVDNMEMSDECEVLLYNASRAQLINEVIKPALDSGKLVICDRFIDSTMAYQGYARGLGVDYIKELNSLVCKDCMPDCTIYLDLHPSEAFKRKGGADKDDRLEQQAFDFHVRVYEGYKVAAKMYEDRFVTINAKGSIKEIQQEILKTLRERGIVR